MSGHSKWSTIKRKKGALDAKRGKIFTKLIKEISVAVKESGGDPDGNPRLRLAIQNAKGANMPKDNIERAIKKADGQDGANFLESTFEGYGPFGIAVFVECLTDNSKRTVQDVRAAFTKYNGSLGTNGSLEFIFDRKGIFVIPAPEGLEMEEFELEMIDAGAEDIEVEGEFITVTSEMGEFGNIQKKLEGLNIEAETAELQRIPNNTKELSDDEFQSFMKLIDSLEDSDDVQKVYHNLEVNDSQMDLL